MGLKRIKQYLSKGNRFKRTLQLTSNVKQTKKVRYLDSLEMMEVGSTKLR